MFRTVIIGGSGYSGAELLRLCASHPHLEVVAATADSKAGTEVADLYPSLSGAYPNMAYVPYEPEHVEHADLVFLALPHGASQRIVPEIIKDDARHIVDLAADFRLDDAALYPQWYSETHQAPDLLNEFVFGLPELYREQITGARMVAAPGCYVTCSVLALAPLVAAGLVQTTGIVVDAASGVSGAGRVPRDQTTFCTVDEDFTAYGLLEHRHTPEIEMVLRRSADTQVEVLFTPHLAPMSRGILATCYARPTSPTTTSEVLSCLADTYASEPFVIVDHRLPHTKSTLGSNTCHITARVDPRTGWVVVISALDNLVKGASGQAIQCANLALGLPETCGLGVTGVYP